MTVLLKKEGVGVEPEVLREIFSMDDEDELGEVIQVCEGEWRREGELYFFYKEQEDD